MSQELIAKIQELECLLEIEREKNLSSSNIMSKLLSENIELSAKLNFLNRKFNETTQHNNKIIAEHQKKTEEQQEAQETELQEDQEPKNDLSEKNEVENSDPNFVIPE